MDKETIVKEFAPLLEQFKNDMFALSQALHENFPLLVEEIYRWEFCTTLALFSLGVCLLSTTIPLALYGRKLDIKSREDGKYSDSGWLCLGFLGLVGIPFVAINYTWFQILIAPRLFLVEYVKGLF